VRTSGRRDQARRAAGRERRCRRISRAATLRCRPWVCIIDRGGRDVARTLGAATAGRARRAHPRDPHADRRDRRESGRDPPHAPPRDLHARSRDLHGLERGLHGPRRALHAPRRALHALEQIDHAPRRILHAARNGHATPATRRHRRAPPVPPRAPRAGRHSRRGGDRRLDLPSGREHLVPCGPPRSWRARRRRGARPAEDDMGTAALIPLRTDADLTAASGAPVVGGGQPIPFIHKAERGLGGSRPAVELALRPPRLRRGRLLGPGSRSRSRSTTPSPATRAAGARRHTSSASVRLGPVRAGGGRRVRSVGGSRAGSGGPSACRASASRSRAQTLADGGRER